MFKTKGTPIESRAILTPTPGAESYSTSLWLPKTLIPQKANGSLYDVYLTLIVDPDILFPLLHSTPYHLSVAYGPTVAPGSTVVFPHNTWSTHISKDWWCNDVKLFP